MATSKVQVTEGSGKNVATNSFSEDAVTKELQRVVLNSSAGVEQATTTNPNHVSIIDQYGFRVEGTPFNELRVIEPVKIVGSVFEGTTLDTNFWTSTIANSATATQGNSQLVLASGTNSAGSVKINSVRRARFVMGSSMRFRGIIQLGDTGTANNTKIWGIAFGATMPTVTDGAYFKSNGATFSVVTKKTNSETVVSSGSFNGASSTYSLDTNVHTYEIYYFASKIYFVIDDVIIHTVNATTATWADTLSHHVYLENTNSGNTTSVSLTARIVGISRLGKLETAPIWKNIHGANTGVSLKNSPGRLHSVSVNAQVNGSTISLYDAASATNPIALIVPGVNTNGNTFIYDLDFFTGLWVVTANAATDVTIVYE